MHQESESEKLPLNASSIHRGGSGSGDDAPLLDLNLPSGVPITNHPTPTVQKLIDWLSQQVDTSNGDKSLAAVNELKYMLQICQEEIDSRNAAQTKAGVGACHSSSQPKYRKLSEISEEVGLNNAMDMGSPEKSEGKTNAAFSEELSSMRIVMSTRSKDGDRHVQNDSSISATKSYVPSKPHPSDRKPMKDRQLFSNRKQDFRFPGTSSRISMRRASAYRRTMNSESDKVQHIVLSDDEDGESLHTLQDADTNDYRNCKIYYPSRDDPECVELAYGDIKSLRPRSYLSSPIMNFYIQYIRRSPSSIAMQKECFVFNTYFYSKLEEAINCEGDKDAAFLKMRRWWKGVDLFQKPYVLLPIHGEMHWSLVIICIPAKEDESGPILLHLDSLEIHSSAHILQVVSKFLLQEWNYIKKNCSIQDLPFSLNVWEALPWRIDKETIMVPRQTNGHDCGLFVLYCMQRFIEEAPERMKKEDLSRFGKKWFLPEEASSLRGKVRDALSDEFEKNMLSDSVVYDAGDS